MGQLAVSTRRLFILRDVQSSKVPVRYLGVCIHIFFPYLRPAFSETLRTFIRVGLLTL